MNGRMDKRREEWMDGEKDGWCDGRINRGTKGWMEGCLCVWMDRGLDG